MELPNDTLAQFKGMTVASGTDNTSKDVYIPKPAQGQSNFDDGREVELLHFVYDHPSLADIRGSPKGVLDVIDEYGRTKNWLMNVGNKKSKIVTDLIAEVKPNTMVELGGYVGYSAIAFGDAVKKAGGKQYFSLERNPEFAAVIMSLVDLAGLRDVVKVVVGPSSDSINRLYAEGSLKHIDAMFLDHYKPAYTTDLKLCEHLKLITPGSVLAADNVIDPGNPPYLAYVRSSVTEKRKQFQKTDTGNDIDDHNWDENTKSKYTGRVGQEKLSTDVKGNPNLVYESKLVESFEPAGTPDGVEVTRCVGEESE